MVIAILIYQEQQLSQERFHHEQTHLQEQIRDRFFGVMDKFEHVYSKIVDLIEYANNEPNSNLAIMMYWLWFGIDQCLYNDTTVEIESLVLIPNKSRVRQLLDERINKGLETTIVIYHPQEAAAELKKFIKVVLTWQINRKHTESSVTSPPRVITDNEVECLFNHYVSDLNRLKDRRHETPDTKFKEFKLRHIIPMLMFAMEVPRGVSRGFVYLGETDALAKGAKTGGFSSEDFRIVEVLKEQIWMEEPPVPRTVSTPAS